MTRIRQRLTVLLLACLAVPAAALAEPRLRPVVEVDSEAVTLGDLFENAGPRAATAVMRAPPPGQSTTLDLATVFDLASGQGLSWRPVASFDRVIVRRASRSLSTDDVVGAIERALRESGRGDRFEIVLPAGGFDIQVPRGALAEIAVDRIDHDRAAAAFEAVLRVTPAGGRPQTVLVSGRAHAMVEVPVLHTRLRPDDVIRADDISWQTVRADRLDRDAITDDRALVGMSPRRTVTPGRPLRGDEVGKPILVLKGEAVTMRLVTPRMELTAGGRALDSGAEGDVVRVRNQDSRLVVEARVVAPGMVSVAPGRPLVRTN